jgi:hypothetical protein
MQQREWAGLHGARWLAAVATVAALSGSPGCLAEVNEDEVVLAATVPARVLTGAALFVVADAGAVSAADQAVRQRLEGIGLTVTTRSDELVLATDATGKALVVISASVDSAQVGTKLTAVPVPLVTWEDALYDELAMATSSGVVGGQTGIEVLYAAHPAAGGQRDAVTVVAAASQVRWGTPGASAAIVALASGGPQRAAHFVYEQGAPLTSGVAAPARRVGTFLDPSTSHQLTDAGWAIFDASIVWAVRGGGPRPETPPVCALSGQALFVVADTAAVNAADQAVRQRLGELGLTVVTQSDGRVTAAEATGKRLVVISGSVASGDIGTMFTDVAVPVLTWEDALYDELGIATSSGLEASAQRVDLVASAHPSAAALAGDVPVLTTPGGIRWGRPVASATVVARIAGARDRAAHFAIEAGAALTGGRIAPARRVGTFLDENWSHRLTPAGLALFDAAVVWAAGGAASRPTAMLVTGDHALEPGDGAVKARLEALGFAVRVVWQSRLHEASLYGVGLVMITESIQSAEVGSFFTERRIPVVVAENALLDDMGMVTAWGELSGQRDLDIVRPASRLAAGHSGRVTVNGTATSLIWGRPSAAADVAATVAGDPTRAALFGYEVGAAMPGLSAPARRVGLLMFQGTTLTAAGWALFDAAVSWAASQPMPSVCGGGVGGGPCTRTVCDAAGCRVVAEADGATCDDGLYCTIDDVCRAGVCGGAPRSCDASVDACVTVACDESADACVPTSRPELCELSCTSGSALAAYRDGWQAGRRRIQRAWRKTDDCDALDGFLDRASARLEALLVQRDSTELSTDRRCRVSGKFDGGLAALEDLQVRCDDACVMGGALVGEAAAVAYCELAIETGGVVEVDEWLRGPVNLCGLGHEVTCDGVFIGETTAYRSASGVCAPYTDGVYEEMWDRSRERSCDYRNRDGQ